MRIHAIIIAIIFLATSVNAYENPLEKQDFEFIKKFLNTVQAKSFEQNSEFCGYIYINKVGKLSVTKPTKGDADSCLADEPAEDLALISSYHTHGAFTPDADTEVPSSNDILADIDEEVDGFISTPGGRIWYLDSVKETATMLCGEKCVLQDPNYDVNLIYVPKEFYTLQELIDEEQ